MAHFILSSATLTTITTTLRLWLVLHFSGLSRECQDSWQGPKGRSEWGWPCLYLPGVRWKRENASSRLLQEAHRGVLLSNNVFVAPELGAVLKMDGGRNSNNSYGEPTFICCLWEPKHSLSPWKSSRWKMFLCLAERLENQDRENFYKTLWEVIGGGWDARSICRLLFHLHRMTVVRRMGVISVTQEEGKTDESSSA